MIGCLMVIFLPLGLRSQGDKISSITIDTKSGLRLHEFATDKGQRVNAKELIPLFSFCINDSLIFSSELVVNEHKDSIQFTLGKSLEGNFTPMREMRSYHATLRFRNLSSKMLKISNVVPLGQGDDKFI